MFVPWIHKNFRHLVFPRIEVPRECLNRVRMTASKIQTRPRPGWHASISLVCPRVGSETRSQSIRKSTTDFVKRSAHFSLPYRALLIFPSNSPEIRMGTWESAVSSSPDLWSVLKAIFYSRQLLQLWSLSSRVWWCCTKGFPVEHYRVCFVRIPAFNFRLHQVTGELL